MKRNIILLAIMGIIVFLPGSMCPKEKQTLPTTGVNYGEQQVEQKETNYYGFSWWQVLCLIGGLIFILIMLRKLRLLEPNLKG